MLPAFLLCALLGALWVAGASAATTKITVTVVMSSAPSDAATITVNGNVRTWKTAVTVPSTQILIGATAAECKTNLFNQLALNPITGLSLVDKGSATIDIIGACGGALSVSLSAAYGTQTPASSTCSSMVDVRVPITGEPTAAQGTNIASLLVSGIDALATNSFTATATAVANLVGLPNAQTISGAKIFTGAVLISNAANIYQLGIVSNLAQLSGNVYGLTNGVIWSVALVDPTLTNGVNYGNAFRSPGAGTDSEQFGTDAAALGAGSVAIGATAGATNLGATAVGFGAVADEDLSSAFGDFANASGDRSLALGAQSFAQASNSVAIGNSADAGYMNSVALGYGASSTAISQVRLGRSTEHVSIPGPLSAMGNCELTFNRFAITSLANGVNAAVAVGTNTFIEVSGPTAAFTIDGIANGRDGKILIVVNQTTYDMGIAHQSGSDGTAANRIISMTGATRTTTGNGAAMLIYSGAASRWILVHLDP